SLRERTADPLAERADHPSPPPQGGRGQDKRRRGCLFEPPNSPDNDKDLLMASSVNPDAAANSPSALDRLAANIRPVAFGLIVAGLALLVLSFVIGIKYPASFEVPVTVSATAGAEAPASGTSRVPAA